MSVLNGKVAIVTGASSGIGRATAKLFAREGANVIAVARRRRELDTLVAEIVHEGGTAVAVAGDVREEAVARRSVAVAADRFGGLDIAVNNAGTNGALAPLPEISPESWAETIETNLTSAFLGARHQIPAMLARDGGSIVFTSSFVGHTVGFPGMSAYAASKAGLVGMMQVIAAEFGSRGIRANAILPGGTDTDMGRAVADTPELQSYVAGLHALKRLAAPDEIAGTILHLASDASSFVTGAAILADGGVSISRA